MTERYVGTVVSFNNLKGFGYLTCPRRDDVYCHISVIRRSNYQTLVAGEAVEYKIYAGPHGKEAIHVVVVSERRP